MIDVFNNKEQTVLESIKDAIEEEDRQSQYSVLQCRIDLYFCEYKLAIEVDEYSHCDMVSSDDREEREKRLKKELGCVFIRINPDEIIFHIFKSINEIQRDMKKVSKKLTKKETRNLLIDDLKKMLLNIQIWEK